MNPLPPSSASLSPRWTRWAFVVALGLAGATALAANDPRAAKYYEDALQRFEKKDHAGAIVQLKSALQIDRSLLPVHVLLGKSLLANGEVAAAEVAFNEALTLGVNRSEVVLPMARAVVAQGKQRDVVEQPRFAPAGLPTGLQAQLLVVRAGALGDMGDTRGALKALEESRALDPQSPDPWVAEIPIRVRMRQGKEALAAADKALALAPNSADALYLRGTVLHVMGDAAGARAAYDRALQAVPTHTEALVSRAGLALDSGKVQDAQRDVDELLKSSPREPRGQYLRALIAETRRDSAASKAAMNEVTALLDPVPMEFFRYRPQILMLGAMAHYGLNQMEKAKPYLEMALRAQPNSPGAKLLGQIFLAEKNYDRGIEALDSYLKAHPNDAQAVHLLASAHMSQGRHARAAQLIQDALRLNDQPGMRTMLGLSMVSSGKIGNAVTELEAAFRKDPSQIQAGSALATIYLQTGQTAQAVKVADILQKQQPNNAGVLNVVGLVRGGARDTTGARAAFEQAIKLDPGFAAPQVNLARLDRMAKDYDKAFARLNAVLKTDERNVHALSEASLLYSLVGRPADAQKTLEKAADHSGPQDLEPGLALVEFHLRAGKPDLAREAAKRLTSKAPDDPRVLVAVARADLASGQAATARTGLSRAASSAATDPNLLVQIAVLQVQADHLPGAAYTLEKALVERPDLLPAQALMAEVELRQGDPAKSEKRARQIIAKYPKLGLGHALLGDVARARKDLPGALAAYRTAHQLEQSSESLMRLFAAQSAIDPRAAAQLADQWLKAHPNDVAARRAQADAHARGGNFAAARTAYEALLKLTPDDAEALNNLAHLLILTGDPTGALKAANTAMQKEPGRAHIIGTNGWAAFKAGQPDRALLLLRDARLRDPNNLDTRYFLGAVLAGTGRKTEARDELEAALQVSRNFANAKAAQDLLATLK